MQRKMNYAFSLTAGVLAAAAVCGIVSLTVRSFGDWMLYFGEHFDFADMREYALIFTQLRDAELKLPVVFLLVLCCAVSVGLCILFLRCIKKRSALLIAARVLLALLAFLGIVVFALLLTEVNSVLFFRALKALVGFV